jgi:ketosteroid isomerase-like protein
VSEFASDADRDAVLRRLLDESEIRAVLARYARGIDHGDMDLVRSCYHHDATDAHGRFNGLVEGFIGSSREFTEKLESMTHVFGQSTIELDGDTAWVESYCLCPIRIRAQDGQPAIERIGNIRYVDVFERRDGTWRIARRKVVHHPGRLEPVEIDAPLAEQAMRARLDRDDPSYDRRPESFLPATAS